MDYLKQIQEAVSFIQKLQPSAIPIGIILGTGLGSLGDQIDVELEVDYRDIPHFPLSTVESHSGKLIFGTLSGKKVVAMRGRFHYYEGYSMKEVTLPVRVMRKLGVETLLVSNACGGLDPLQEVGDVMIISDHINMFSENPLRGKNYDELGPRFPDMSDTYSVDLMEKAFVIAESRGIKLHRGVYVGVEGPNLETPAEYRYFRVIGGDAVGMSTVPEVLVARHSGMEVFGISAITDLGVEGRIHKVDIAYVLAAAAKAEPVMSLIMRELVRGL